MFSCNLPHALLAEWPGSFMCYCSNTGVEWIPKWVSTESWPWRRKFSHHSCPDSNPWPFNHESSALTTEPCSQRSSMNPVFRDVSTHRKVIRHMKFGGGDANEEIQHHHAENSNQHSKVTQRSTHLFNNQSNKQIKLWLSIHGIPYCHLKKKKKNMLPTEIILQVVLCIVQRQHELTPNS